MQRGSHGAIAISIVHSCRNWPQDPAIIGTACGTRDTGGFSVAPITELGEVDQALRLRNKSFRKEG
jgi:hypothetical protein